MYVVVDGTPGHVQSIDRRHWCARSVWVLVTIGLASFAICSSNPARCEESTPTIGAGNNEYMTRRNVAYRLSLMEKEAFEMADGNGLRNSAATMRQAADIAKSTFGERHWLTVWDQSLADGLKSVADLPASQRELFVESLSLQATGIALASQNKRDLALKELRRAHEKRVEAIGPGHILTAYSLFVISTLENQLGVAEIAKQHSLEMLAVAAECWGKNHPGYAYGLETLAWAEGQLNDHTSSEKHAQEVMAILEPTLAEGLSETSFQINAIANWLLAKARNEQGRYAEAEEPARRAVELLAPYPKEMYFTTLLSVLEVARSQSGQGKFKQADITFTTFYRIQVSKIQPQMAGYVTAVCDEHHRRPRPDVARSEDPQVKTR